MPRDATTGRWHMCARGEGMRIAILNLTGGGMCGGYKKYLQAILPRLSRRPEVASMLCAAPKSVGAANWLERSDKISFVSCRPVSPVNILPDSSMMDALRKFDADLLFVPTERSVRCGNIPVVNMVYNMVPLVGSMKGMPLRERARSCYQRYDARRAFGKASRLVAVSEYVREVLRDRYGVSNDKIRVIHFGADEVDASDSRRPECFPEELRGRFIFTAGSFEGYRGFEDAIGALSMLRKSVPDLQLVVAGGARMAMNSYRDALLRRCSEDGLTSNVHWLGTLSAQEMAWCYENCRAFIMTSRLESFGLINVEALSHGSLCVATTAACMPEIYGNAAEYYRPGDVGALTEAIQRLLKLDDRERMRRRALAVAQAKRFNWDSAAEKLVQVFASCMGRD